MDKLKALDACKQEIRQAVYLGPSRRRSRRALKCLVSDHETEPWTRDLITLAQQELEREIVANAPLDIVDLRLERLEQTIYQMLVSRYSVGFFSRDTVEGVAFMAATISLVAIFNVGLEAQKRYHRLRQQRQQ